MVYTVHFTHRKGNTLAVIPKDLASANKYLSDMGHVAAKDLYKHSKIDAFNYQVNYEVIEGDEDAN